MTITLQTKPGQKFIELGGGSNPQIRPNVDCRACFDPAGNPTVDFTADFNEQLPIKSEEWDGVFAQYVIEHLSWRNVPFFLSEVFRILKPGGKVVFVTANTPAQIKFIEQNPGGWDGNGPFESFSCVLFGDQDYEANTHRNFMSPDLIHMLLEGTGFKGITIRPYGTRETDMVVEAVRPTISITSPFKLTQDQEPIMQEMLTAITTKPRDAVAQGDEGVVSPAFMSSPALSPPEVLFDKHYFNGGGKVGGYTREGYRDFPAHEVTARHVLSRKPQSVLELGAARGYILKRLQDAGVPARGLEVSKHCYLTRACEGIFLTNLCDPVWNIDTHPDQPSYDLCFSIATLEHIPEQYLSRVIQNMRIHCKRGLHGIDFGHNDDGFDKTHCTLKPLEWWQQQFATHAPVWPVEIVDKEELERGDFPQEVLNPRDGKIKLNIGSFTTMHHWGWHNLDLHDLNGFAQANGYIFRQVDVRNGLPYPTGGVDLIVMNHFLEHLTYEEGLRFLRECRRVIKPDGAMRIVVPNAEWLTNMYTAGLNELSELDEINDGSSSCPTAAGKLWSLLFAGHQAMYDGGTLSHLLKQAAFDPILSKFREDNLPHQFMQIRRETTDIQPSLSLMVNAVPLTA